MNVKFNNQISLDGVAVLSVAVGAALWLGNLDAKVNNLSKDSEAAKTHIEKLAENQKDIAITLANIAAQVNTIDRKEPPKKP